MDEYKIAIFHGDNPIDFNHGFQDGEIEIFGKREEKAYHILEFIERIKEKYNDVPLLCGVKPTYPGHAPACFFTLLGDPVFYNNTPNDKKYGKMGQLYLPNSISTEQKESVLEFAKTISNYQISIFYDIQIIEGEICSKTKTIMPEKDNYNFIKELFEHDIIEIRENTKKM